MDVNRGEGLDGEHASPGRILAPSPSSQRFLGLPPTILNIFWNAFEIFNKRWNVLQSLNISFKHLLSTTFLLADMIEKCGSTSTQRKLSAIVLFGPNNFGQCQLKKRCRAHQRMIKIDRVPIWLPGASGLGNQTINMAQHFRWALLLVSVFHSRWLKLNT